MRAIIYPHKVKAIEHRDGLHRLDHVRGCPLCEVCFICDKPGRFAWSLRWSPRKRKYHHRWRCPR